MTVVALALGLGILCMPRWLAPLARRLDPRDRVRVCVTAIACGALLVELSLVLSAVPAMLGLLGNDALAATCRRLLGDLAPGGLQVGWSAAVLALVLPILGRRGWQRATAATDEMRAEPALGVHSALNGIDMVRLPTAALVAYSIDSPHPQIVVSEGLVALLSPDELAVVIGHEAMHVRERHGRILRALAALETPVPAIRWATWSLRVALERCADEAATGQDTARRAAMVDALLKIGDGSVVAPVPAFTSRSGVVERAQALLVAPPAPTRMQRVAARLALGGAVVCSLVVLGGWAVEAHMMLSMAGICRM